MVKKIDAYECSVCETAYFDKETADTCEKTHFAEKSLRIIEVKHKSQDEQFPDVLMVDCDSHSGVGAIYDKRKEDSCESIAEEWEND